MSEQLPVTLVTVNASNDFTDEEYRRELLDLWQGEAEQSYPKLLEILGEPMSRKAWWHHRITGNRTTFGPNERNILRRAIDDAAPVRPSVTSVTQRLVHPDAAVYTVGEITHEQSRLMLIVAPNVTHAEISANGTISARTVAEHQGSAVTPVISSDKPKKAPVYRPVFSKEDEARFEALGGIRKVLDAGIEMANLRALVTNGASAEEILKLLQQGGER